MINSKDTKIIKELVLSSVFQVTRDFVTLLKIQKIIESAFDIVINEMEQGKI